MADDGRPEKSHGERSKKPLPEAVSVTENLLFSCCLCYISTLICVVQSVIRSQHARADILRIHTPTRAYTLSADILRIHTPTRAYTLSADIA